MSFSLMLDVLVALLLIVTIGYAMVLNRRLSSLRRDKEQLEGLALNFGDSTVRAEKSIGELRASSEMLQDRIDKAKALRDDLVFLVDRGNGTADRMEDLVRAARDDLGISPKPANAPPAAAAAAAAAPPASDAAPIRKAPNPLAGIEDGAKTGDDDGQASAAERELLKALRSAG